MGCDRHIERVLAMSSQLLELANSDRSDCEHDRCLMLDGLVRDCAMKIRQEALQWRLERGEQGQRSFAN